MQWLNDFCLIGGRFDTHQSRTTKNIIIPAKNKLNSSYTHPKLVTELDFGLWRYLFAQPQFRVAGQSLLQIFPSKPASTPTIQYNHTYMFNELAKVNDLRNRIAHHEPICFLSNNPVIDTCIRQDYNLILQFFRWMKINEAELLYGLDILLMYVMRSIIFNEIMNNRIL
ncbi:hypothetical protein [Chryseobacterium geocarposphaerae]|uniref:hypothetical protein n=1 Tax=Chryseobacterium geocarposphaerae TaxID=1416776 RepID=UPI001E301943|nr:hypothetical protein [Chryseobacterium geocarposphaerae]